VSGGTCVPQEGQPFCYTLIEIPNSVGLNAYSPQSINDRGEVLFDDYMSDGCRYSDTPVNEPCALVWRNGQVRMLPNRFQPIGGMSNDGTVAGQLFSGTNIEKPAVVTPSSNTAVELANPIPQSNGDPPSGTYYRTDTISPNGRVTYHMVRGGYSYSGQDYGFCQSYSQTSNVLYCWRERFYETSGPNYGAGTLIHSSDITNGEGRTTLFFDNDSHGRGGDIGRYSSSDYFASFNFQAGTADEVLHMADRNGVRVVSNRHSGHIELRDTTLTVPTGYRPYQLTGSGHGLMCSIGLNENGEYSARIFNTNNNFVGEAFDAYRTVRINDVDVIVSMSCERAQAGQRKTDGLGRVLAIAFSQNNSSLRAVILTPPGVALP
jgi:hypothetical protein